ncbi:MAG: tRNA preQ1(34) S-adenosylmethionine ribosyltransferase-isomerase QueA [Bryobacteraceae bacterium]
MNLSEFDYHLPPELIAQEPPADRAGARMLVVHRGEGRWEDRVFRDLPGFLSPGDCLALNDSRVFPARLLGTRAGVHALPVGKRNPARREHLTGETEVMLLRPTGPDAREWSALVHPGRKMKTGEIVRFPGGLEAQVIARGEYGERTVRFRLEGDIWEAFERVGHVPLPPYIKRGDTPADRERYQTVFARERGSVAAPTAGLHFTPDVLEACRARGAGLAYVTLHVGLGTFQPLRAERVEAGRLHQEFFRITEENAARLRAAQRIVAVGTTAVRTLETAAARGGIAAMSGDTDIFIYPGYRFRAAGAMLTNFHLPRTSLLLLVCAFAGKELALAAYEHAVREKYRFYSYGDCMLIL